MKPLMVVLVLVASVVTAAPVTAQQLDAVAAEIAPKLEASRKSVAVVDFTDLQGNATELGRYLAEELSIALARRATSYMVVDRTHLKAILQEHKLAASGVIDPATARQLGKLAGVDTLVTGTLTPLGDRVRLSVKALDAQTAGMVSATAVDIPRTNAIEELLGRSVGAPGVQGSGWTNPPGSSGRNTYKTEFLLGSVESVGMSDKLTVSISLQNILRDKPVHLAAQCCYGAWLLAVDNNGNRWKVDDQRDVTTLPAPYDRNFARLAPGDKLFVNARLTPDAPRGALVPRPQWISVTGALFMRSDDDQRSMERGGERKDGHPFTFGVTNIPVPPGK